MRKFTSIAALAVSSVVASTSFAGFTYNNGFESPSYTAGGLSGQGSWFVDQGPTTGYVGTLPTNTIQSINNGGTQALRYNSPNGDIMGYTYAISPIRSLFSDTADMTGSAWVVSVKWDMRVDDNVTPLNGTEFFGLEVYDSTATKRVAGFIRGYDNDVTNSYQLYRTGSNGNFANPGIGLAPSSGAWGSYEMRMNYITRQYDVLLNGNLVLGSQPFNATADNGFDLNFTMTGHGVDSAYFDNLSVTAVPEPTSAALLGLGALALGARRRK